jgi:hypothetical protein
MFRPAGAGFPVYVSANIRKKMPNLHHRQLFFTETRKVVRKAFAPSMQIFPTPETLRDVCLAQE